MKQRLLALVGLVFIMVLTGYVEAQNVQIVRVVNTPPVGACSLPNQLTMVTVGAGAGLYQCVNNAWVFTPPGGGSGTFGGFGSSSTSVSPLFTTSVTNPNTSPFQTFTLSNAPQNAIFAGPASGGAGLPSYQTTPAFSAANLFNFPTFNQSTTGNAATATAFATAPAACTTGQYVTGISVTGNPTCATPAGGVTTPATTQLYKGNGSANNIIVATPGTDYVLPGGNVATATALAATPAACTTGQYVTAISANGTPTCSTPAGGTTSPATNNLYKGNGTANNIVVATPGTDYLLPTGSAAGLTNIPACATCGTSANNLGFFAATTSAQLRGIVSDETGSGAAVFATSPTFVTPALGTPASGVVTNLTGTGAFNTTGNAATATALGATPTACSAGSATTGISSTGNSLGCFTPGTVASGNQYAPAYYTSSGTAIGSPTAFAGLAYFSTSAAPTAATGSQIASSFTTSTVAPTSVLGSDGQAHPVTPLGTPGQFPQMNAGATGYVPVSISQDSTIAVGGAMTNVGINGTLLSSLASGLYRNTTSTGAVSIETAAQFLTDATAGLKTGTNCNTSNSYYFSPFSGTCVLVTSGGSGTVNSGSAYSPAYYPTGGGTQVSGVTPFSGLAYYSTTAAPVAVTTLTNCNISSGYYYSPFTGNCISTAVAAITSGTIDGTVIGGTTPAQATFNRVFLAATNTATSTNNYPSYDVNWQGSYYDGTTNQTDGWGAKDVMGTGANPTSTLTFAHVGSTGAATVTFPAISTTTGGSTIQGAAITGLFTFNSGSRLLTGVAGTSATTFDVNNGTAFGPLAINNINAGNTGPGLLITMGNATKPAIYTTSPLQAGQLVGSSATPTITFGAAAGSAPTATSITGNNLDFTVTFTAGGTIVANSTLFTVTFNGTLQTTTPRVVCQSNNVLTSSVWNNLANGIKNSTTYSQVTGATALASGTVYSEDCQVHQ